MNIAIISRSLPVHCLGGMELVAWDLIQGLAAKSHNIWVITTAIPGDATFSAPSHLADKITVDFLNGTRPGRYSRAWWKESRYAFLKKRDLFNPDLVISISVGAMSVLPVLGNIPAIIQSHGTFLGEVHSKIQTGKISSIISSFHNLLWIPWERRTYSKVRRIVAVGPAVLSELQRPILKVPFSKVVLIPNGVDTDLFHPIIDQKINTRKQLGIPADAKVLVWASRLHKQKGTHLALNAFAGIDAQDYWFLVIGDGPERHALEKQSHELRISGRVIFAGAVAHDSMSEFLNAGDIFVFTPNGREGFPLNVLEAMSIDLPVVISNHLAKPFIGAKGVYPVNPYETEGVARAIEKAASSGKGDRSFVMKNYSREKMLDSYEKLFEEVARKRD